jgi:hypothetical protein
MCIYKNNNKVILFFTTIICFYGCVTNGEIITNVAEFQYNPFGERIIIQEKSSNAYFIIDTGSEESVIFSDRFSLPSKFKGIKIVNNSRISYLRKLDSITFGKIILRNQNFMFMSSKHTFFVNDTNIVGIIGMNILSQKYCFFDLKNQTLTLSDKKDPQTETPFFIFSYKSSSRLLSDLFINGNIFKNVLFDTGSSSFLALLEKDRKKINTQSSLKEDINYDFFNNQHQIYIEQPDSLAINNIRFINPIISYNQKHRLLGMKFVTCWSSFLIDPFNKTIEFYL